MPSHFSEKNPIKIIILIINNALLGFPLFGEEPQIPMTELRNPKQERFQGASKTRFVLNI